MERAGVAVLVVQDRKGLWLVDSAHGLTGFVFTEPGGLTLEEGDRPIDALVRWAADELDLLSYSAHTVATLQLQVPTHVFTVRINTASHVPDGLATARYVEARGVLQLIVSGEITDAATIIGIQDSLIPRDIQHRAPRGW